MRRIKKHKEETVREIMEDYVGEYLKGLEEIDTDFEKKTELREADYAKRHEKVMGFANGIGTELLNALKSTGEAIRNFGRSFSEEARADIDYTADMFADRSERGTARKDLRTEIVEELNTKIMTKEDELGELYGAGEEVAGRLKGLKYKFKKAVV